MPQMRDEVTVLMDGGVAKSRDGYLSGMGKIARAGNVQHYYGKEIGLTGDQATQVFGVYRDPEVVFNEDNMRTLIGRPITRGHPRVPVTADNHKHLSVGHIGGRVVRDGEHVTAPMAFTDAAAVAEVEAGAIGLSAGYVVDVVPCEGVNEAGEAYQFKQSGKLSFNHVAYLPDNNPRAGNTTFGDSAEFWGARPVTVGDASAQRKEKSMNTRTIIVDGLSVETTDAGAQAIDKLQKQLADANTAHGTKVAELTKTISDRDSRIGELEVENKSLKDAQLDDAAIEARVTARTQLVADAQLVDKDFDAKGKSEADIRRAVVTKVLGDAVSNETNDDTIKGMFKAVVAQATKDAARDPLARHMAPNGTNRAPQVQDAAMIQDEDAAYQASIADLNPTRAH